MTMIEIDGSVGEGGGQIVRSSLALAAITAFPLKLINIRAGRSKPGLLRQHLTGVKAITEICDAQTDGDHLGSQELTFVPSSVRGGEYSFQVGSAGSAVLVAQTILPALMAADQPSKVTIVGGTHAAFAPPFDFFDRCYLPLLRRMGARVKAAINRYGFYPAGGGEMVVEVEPAPLRSLRLLDRQGKLSPRVTALVSQIRPSIGDRQCDVVRRKAAWPADVCQVIDVDRAGGPGNALLIECQFENVTEIVVGLGKVGVRAEQVARSAVREVNRYLSSQAPVGEYLADQLLLPMAWAAQGGHASRFRTVALSLHSKTQLEILRRFLDVDIQVDQHEDIVEVSIGPTGNETSMLN